MAEETVIIDVKINTDEAAKQLAGVNSALAALKQQNKELKKEIESGNDAFGENSKQVAENEKVIKLLTAQQKALSGQIQTAVKENDDYGDSFYELTASVRALEKEYKSLTKEQRNTEEGQALKQTIIEQKEALKEFDAELGNHQKNVGNYPGAMGRMASSLSNAQNTLAGFTDAMKGGVVGLKGLGKSVVSFGKVLLTTPLGWIAVALGTVVGLFNKLKEAIQKNDNAGTSFAKMFASLQPIIDMIGKALDSVAGMLGKVAEKISSFIAKFSGSAKEAITAAQNLVAAKDELEESERQNALAQSQRDKQISDLRAKVAEKDKYTAQERRKYLEKAIALEQENLKEEQEIAQKKIDIAKAEIERGRKSGETWEELYNRQSDDVKNAYNNLLVEKNKLETNYNAKQREFNAQRAEISNQEIANQKKAAEELRKTRQTSLEVERLLIDAENEMIEDEGARALAIQKTQNERELEELKKRLEEDSTLTGEARKKYEDYVKQREIQLNSELEEMQEEFAQGQAEKALQRALQSVKIRLEAVKKGSEQERELLSEQMDLQMQDELNKVEDNEELKNAIRQKYANQRAEMRANEIRAEWEREKEEMQAVYDEKKEIANDNYLEQQEIELERAIEERDRLLSMDEETKAALFDSQQAYEQAVIESNRNIQQSIADLQEAERNLSREIISGVGSIFGAMGDLLETYSDENKEAAKAAKAVALGELLINQGVALSKALAEAFSLGPIEAIPYYLSAAATIISTIAQARNIIKGAKFATGGIVAGNSYSGDKVPIQVNSGEMVLNMEQQKHLFDIANSGQNYQTGIDYERLAQSVAALPAPVLVMSEFRDESNKIANLEEMQTIN